MKIFKYIIFFLLIVLICMIGWYNIDFSKFKIKKTGSNRPFGIERDQAQTATTSAIFKLSSAASSSSSALDISKTDKVVLNFGVESTSTIPTLHFDYDLTYDQAGASRNWFKVNNSLTNKSMATTSSETGMIYRSFVVSNLIGNYLQVNYRVTGADSDVYLEVLKDNSK